MKATLWFVMFLFAAVFTLHAAPESAAPEPQRMRMVFKAYDGPANDRYHQTSFQIDTIDIRQPSRFLKLGQMIPNTKFKVVKFIFKEEKNDMTGEMDDASELAIVHTVTGKTATLTYNKVVDVSK